MDDFEEHGISSREDSDYSEANCAISDYVPSKDATGEHSASKDNSLAESESNRDDAKTLREKLTYFLVANDHNEKHNPEIRTIGKIWCDNIIFIHKGNGLSSRPFSTILMFC
uniref:Uncharacterized protein n=1 Tax=Oryza meridionalis TaxID=40149 RepID=A0A0E0CEI4_9ORYZ